MGMKKASIYIGVEYFEEKDNKTYIIGNYYANKKKNYNQNELDVIFDNMTKEILTKETFEDILSDKIYILSKIDQNHSTWMISENKNLPIPV